MNSDYILFSSTAIIITITVIVATTPYFSMFFNYIKDHNKIRKQNHICEVRAELKLLSNQAQDIEDFLLYNINNLCKKTQKRLVAKITQLRTK